MNVSQGIIQLPNPLFFLCSHPSSFILCRYSFIFCQRPKQIPKDCSEALPWVSPSLSILCSSNSSCPRLFNFCLCLIRLVIHLFPAWECLSSHHDANLPPGREAGPAWHSPCLFPASQRSQCLWTVSMSVDYCPVYSFQFSSCLWQGDSSRPSYSIRIRTLFELDFLWNFLVVLAHFLLCRQLKFNYTEKTTY